MSPTPESPAPVAVMCFDRNYAPYAAVTAFSAIMRSSVPLDWHFIVPREDLSAATESLRPLERLRGRFRVTTVDASAFSAWKVEGHVNTTTYLKTIIPDVVDARKAIYLDSDLLVQADLADLEKIDLGGAWIGGVYDDYARNTTKVVYASPDLYLNSGVMVMDLSALREAGFSSRCREFHAGNTAPLVFADQCVINKVAEGFKVRIDPRWNRLVPGEFLSESGWAAFSAPENAFILHYASELKPWRAWCNPVVAKAWRNHAEVLVPGGGQPTACRTVRQLRQLTRYLDAAGEFREASRVREETVRGLLGALERVRAGGA